MILDETALASPVGWAIEDEFDTASGTGENTMQAIQSLEKDANSRFSDANWIVQLHFIYGAKSVTALGLAVVARRV